MAILIKCNRDCTKCSSLNTKTDDKGCPWGYDCLKYGDTVELSQFQGTKIFKEE